MNTNHINNLLKAAKLIAKKGIYWNQGLGGNLSVKISNKSMLIKSSGFRLDSLTKKNGLSDIDWIKLRNFCINNLKKKRRSELAYSKFITALSVDKKNRPSMESAFHAILPHKYILHFHPISSLLISEAYKKSKSFNQFKTLKTLFDDVSYFDFIIPGSKIAYEILKNYKFSKQGTACIFLRGHGVILAGKNPAKLLESWQAVEKEAQRHFHYKAVPVKQLIKLPSKYRPYTPDLIVFSKAIKQMTKNKAASLHAFNKNTHELYLLNSYLYNFFPKITIWPTKASRKISVLPTEALRIKKI